VAEPDADAVVLEAERRKHEIHERQAAAQLIGHLLLGAEEMRVVLREAAHASEAIELARLLPSIDGAELREPHWQIAGAVRRGCEHADVMRAVHRLEEEAVDRSLREPVRELRAAAGLLRAAPEH